MPTRTALAVTLVTSAVLAQPSPVALQAALNAAIASHTPQFTIPPGSYNFSATNFLVYDAFNLVIEGSGASLVFYPGFGVTVWNSSSVTLRNAVVDYSPPCFTQGVISAVDGPASTLEVTIDPGFPACSAASPLPGPWFNSGEIKVIYFNASTRLHVRGQPGANLATGFVAPSAAGTCRVIIPGFSGFTPAVGWLVTMSARIYATQYKIPDFYQGSTWSILGSRSVTSRNITVLGGGNFAFAEWGGEGGHLYDGVALRRGGGGAHLLSSNLDAFHSFSVGRGPTIVNSHFEFQGDDAMNFHTRAPLLLSADAGVAYVIDVGDIPALNGSNTAPLRAFADVIAGDALRVFASEDSGGAFRGVLSPSSPPVLVQNASMIAAAVAALEALHTVAINPGAVAVWSVPFSSAPAGMAAMDIVQFDRRACVGGSVINTTFAEAYDSSFRLQASGTLVQDSTYTHMPGGIHIVYDQGWLEGSKGIANVSIVDNTFIDIGAPPYASSMKQVLDADADVVNVTVAGNTVLQVPESRR